MLFTPVSSPCFDAVDARRTCFDLCCTCFMPIPPFHLACCAHFLCSTRLPSHKQEFVSVATQLPFLRARSFITACLYTHHTCARAHHRPGRHTIDVIPTFLPSSHGPMASSTFHVYIDSTTGNKIPTWMASPDGYSFLCIRAPQWAQRSVRAWKCVFAVHVHLSFWLCSDSRPCHCFVHTRQAVY